MAWPNVKCPPPSGPTAKDHLEYIRQKAHAELAPGSSLLSKINHAIESCLLDSCLPTGSPPHDDLHCQRVLWARSLADASAWGSCLDELRHGT